MRNVNAPGVVVAMLAVAVLVVACARPKQPVTTTVTSGTYDVRSGACLCRLPQDELSTCCEGPIELTCKCTASAACSMIPTGRTCGRAP